MKFCKISLDQTESTNKYLLELARDGKEEFTTVTAKSQTGGYGRKGRTFYSENGLYFSVLLRPDIKYADTALITLYCANCVLRALKRVTSESLSIKWVNDILNAKNLKVCGILCEAHVDKDGSVYIIAGIGINLGKGQFPDELCDIAGWLGVPEKKLEKVKTKIVNSVVQDLSKYKKALAKKNFLNYYRMNCSSIDKKVTVYGDGEPYDAIVMGIDDNGGLMIFSEKGARILNYGEITIRPKIDDQENK